MRDESQRSASGEVTDESLMARYADGDPAAFQLLFRRYESRMYAFFRRRTRSPERAQDLYQELFLRVHRARERYDPRRPFAPWLFQVAHRLLLDDVRRAHRVREVPLEEPASRAASAGGEDWLEDRELLGRTLSALSREERYILVSSKLAGVGYPQLAARLGKSVQAVRQVASRSLRRLRAAALAAGAPVSTPR
jgi:RNA polymerase sigma-70 factor (ECF subfamily)